MPNLNPNRTGYFHSFEPNTNDLVHAMDYDASGQPALRVIPEAANKTAFGESYGIEITPTIQLLPVYALDPLNFVSTTTTVNTAIEPLNSYVEVTAGPAVAGVPSITIFRSRKFIRYRAGQGALARWNTAFSTPLAGTEQRAGLFNFEEAMQFAYNGTEFGILHIHAKKNRVEEFTITTPPTGTETVTVTLDSVPYVFSVSGTAAQTAELIAKHTGYGGLYLVEAVGAVVTFIYLNNGAPDTGVFTITGNGTLAATRATKQLPVLGNTDRIPQSEWNVDKMDGTGASGAVLDPTQFNVYQISYSWLGSGKIDFFISNPNTGSPALVHQIQWINRFRILNAQSPSYAVGTGLFNFADTGTLELLFGSIMAGIEGKVENTVYTKSTATTKSNLNSANTIFHLLTVRNSFLNDSSLNYIDVIIDTLSFSVQCNDPSIVYVYMDAPLATGVHTYTALTSANSNISTVDGTIATTVTPLASFTLPPNNGNVLDLSKYEIRVPPGAQVSIGVSSTGNISRAAVSLIWVEE
jgi:hypothetical protein